MRAAKAGGACWQDDGLSGVVEAAASGVVACGVARDGSAVIGS